MYLFFSESGCFRRKIMTQSNRFELASFFSENEVAIGRQRSCLPSKEWKKKKAFSFGFWLILVKHVEFGARLSNPRWFVCERYLLTSLLSYNWLSIKPAFLSNNAWLSSLHYQLEVSINSKKRRLFPGYYPREFPKT